MTDLPQNRIPCEICGEMTDDWVNAQCDPCSNLPGAVLLVELRNAFCWAETRKGSAYEVRDALKNALAEATDAATHMEALEELSQANHDAALDLVKQIRAAGLDHPVCECGHSEGMHVPHGRCSPNLPDYCRCQKFRPQPGLSTPHTRPT